MKRNIWTIEPDTDVREWMEKEIRKQAGKDKRNHRGWRTRIINSVLRKALGGGAA